MKDKLLFLAKLLIISVVLFGIWPYISIIFSFGAKLMAGFKYPSFSGLQMDKMLEQISYQVSLNLIPFIALIAAMPKTKYSIRIAVIIAGLVSYWIFFIASILFGILMIPEDSIIYGTWRSVLAILPIAFWLALSYGQLKELFSPKETTD